jgi:hypothetical protein
MKFSLKPFLFSSLLSVLGLFSPQTLHAQFIGYTSPQTVQQTLASTASCTGAPQIFNVANLGQTQHFATLSVGVTNVSSTLEIDGVDRAGNVTRISDQGFFGSASIGNAYAVIASGYFPVIQVKAGCQSGGTFTLSYSGASSTFTPSVGFYQVSQIDKEIDANATADFTQAMQPPYGNSSGWIFISGSFLGSASLTVTCDGVSGLGLRSPSFVFPLVGTVGSLIAVPAFPCDAITVAYVHGTTAGGTVSVDYLFNPPAQSSDPCASGVIQSAVVNAGAGATVSVVAPAATQSIYACGFSVSQGTAGTFQWVYGTGATCGTGTANLTGAFPTATGTPFTYGGATKTIFQTPISQRLCITTTVGTAVGVLTYVQM